jgi:hypothetical protein
VPSNKRMAKFKLRIPENDLARWAEGYSYPRESEIVDGVAPAARARGYLTRDEFLRLCRWKTARSQSRCAANEDEFVQEVTRVAFSTAHEQLKIGVLRLLKGVSWPTASVILHFCDRGKYPILDYRALWSLSAVPPSQCSFPFWWAYTDFMRQLQERTGLSMRLLDRALWQYSKERQQIKPAHAQGSRR